MPVNLTHGEPVSPSRADAAEASEIRDADSSLVVDAEIVPTARASKSLPAKLQPPPLPPAELRNEPEESRASCSACTIS